MNHSFVEFKREAIEQSLVHRFERQVRCHCGALAIKTGRSSLTYETLNQTANRIANAILSRRGAASEPVALMAEDYATAVAGILGILKAGKIYVPLDPSFPASRIRFILEDAGARVIAAGGQSVGRAEKVKTAQVKLIDLDTLSSSLPDKNIGLALRPDALAWILYTSSSTGEPKGVPQTHRGELHNIMNMTNSQRLCSGDRMTLLRSPILGGAIRNTFSALLNGASLFPMDIKRKGFNGLAEWLVRERITIFHSAASVFRHFARTLSGDESFRSIRLIRLGSEPVTWEDVEVARKHFSPECVLVNALSSTEATTFLQYFVGRATPVTAGTLPVGFPVQDVAVLLLDEQGGKVRPGEVGEIAINSRYLFPGYWRRPELNREVFVPDPDGGDRTVFRTGDLARILPDGSYEYHGRKDFQHKIRGYRVQIDEVETALRAIPDVAQAAVVADESHTTKRLAAYVVPKHGRALAPGALRRALKNKLPDFMIPSIFLPLESLPLTAGGKVNRRALPPPAQLRLNSVNRPRTRLEKLIAGTWQETLNVAGLGVHDNFFDFAGDSLSAAQIVAKLRAVVHVDVRLKTLFRNPTIARLAARIEKMRQRPPVCNAAPIARVPQRNCFPLSHAQTQLWMLNQILFSTPLLNICDARRIRGNLDVRLVRESLRMLIQRHEALRTQFAEDDGRPAQIIAQSIELDMPVVELCELPDAQKETEAFRMAADEADVPFDLARGPLLRAKLFRLAPDDHLLLVTMHHIISDQWSMQLFRHEWALIYGALSRGVAPSLSALAIRFVDFVCWEQQAVQSRFVKAQLAYWEKQLAGGLPRLAFKRGPRKPRMSFRTSRLPVELDEKMLAKLKDFGRKEATTPFMILLAALSAAIYLHTKQRDIRIGSLVANRSMPETERIIGHFINTVVLRQRLSGTLTLREVLAQARENTLAAHARQNIPFEAVVRALEEKRKIDRAAIFQVMLIYHNTIFHPADPPDLVFTQPEPLWEKADAGVTLTTCDLIFQLKETTVGLAGHITFKTAVLDETAVIGIRRTFVRVSGEIIGNPERKLASLGIG